jgi:hypothetical protein
VQGIPASDPHTQETQFQVQKIIDLHHIANNLPDAFTDYKGVTKSLHPARNVPERVETPQKTTQPPKQKKRGRSMATVQEKASCKQLWKQKNKSLETVNLGQSHVDGHYWIVQVRWMGNIHNLAQRC